MCIYIYIDIYIHRDFVKCIGQLCHCGCQRHGVERPLIFIYIYIYMYAYK